MDKTIQNLLIFTRNSIKQTRKKVTIEEPAKLYKIAYENGLSGTIYQSLKDKLEDPKILSFFKRDYFLYIQDDEKKKQTILKIKTLFKEADIDYIFLKGSILKQVYPLSYMRSMGDIDVLVREEDIQKAQDIFKKVNIDLLHRGPIHDTYQMNHVDIEVHRFLRIKDQFVDYTLLDNVWIKAIKIEDNEYHLESELEITYLLYHLKKHLHDSGISLRNVLDIGLYIEAYQTKINIELLHTYLFETKSLNFFNNLILFYDKYMASNLVNILKIDQVFDDELYETFTSYIIKSGTHGLGIDFNTFTTRFASAKNENKTRSKSLLIILFPSYHFMKQKYPKLLKFKLFLPVAWLFRMVVFTFKKPKSMFTKLRKIKASKQENINKTSELYKKMGI